MGLVLSIINEAFPPKSKFKVEDIPDLSGKVIIVTGANTGQLRAFVFALWSAPRHQVPIKVSEKRPQKHSSHIMRRSTSRLGSRKRQRRPSRSSRRKLERREYSSSSIWRI